VTLLQKKKNDDMHEKKKVILVVKKQEHLNLPQILGFFVKNSERKRRTNICKQNIMCVRLFWLYVWSSITARKALWNALSVFSGYLYAKKS